MQVSLHVLYEFGGVHVVDVEEEGRGLDAAGLRVAEGAGNAGLRGNVAVAGGVNDDLGAYAGDAFAAEEADAGDGVILEDRLHEGGVEEHLDACFLAHFVKDELQGLGVERGEVVVAGCDPGAEGSACAHLGRVDRTLDGDHAVHDLLEEAADDHYLSRGVVAGHEGGDEASGGHAAEAVAGLHYGGPGPAAGGGYSRAHARGPSADYQYVSGSPVKVIRCVCAGSGQAAGAGEQRSSGHCGTAGFKKVTSFHILIMCWPLLVYEPLLYKTFLN